MVYGFRDCSCGVLTSACSNSDSTNSGVKIATIKRIQQQMKCRFYAILYEAIDNINSADKDINAYESVLAADPKPPADELANLKQIAAFSAPNVIANIK